MVKIPKISELGDLSTLRSIGEQIVESTKLDKVVNKVKSSVSQATDGIAKPMPEDVSSNEDDTHPIKQQMQQISQAIVDLSVVQNAQTAALGKLNKQMAELDRMIETMLALPASEEAVTKDE